MEADSIKKNYLLNTLLQVFRILVPIITAPYIARVFGPDGVGIRSYTTSLMSVFLIFAVLGTNVYGQQTIAQCRDDRQLRSNNFWGIFFVCSITTFIATVCWCVVVIVYEEYQIILLVLTIQIIAAAIDVSWYFAALEKFSLIVTRNIIIKLATVILLFTFIKSKDDLLLYIFFESISIFLCNLSMWIPLRKSVDKPIFHKICLKQHFEQTLIYFLPTIAASVYSYIDKTMIGLITDSNSENGYYEQAHSIINMAVIFVASLNTVMASRNAYLFSKNQIGEIKEKLRISIAFIMTLAIPISFGIVGIADGFIPWFFGPGYNKVVVLLKLSSPLVILLSIHNFFAAQYLVPSGQRARSTLGVLAGSATNLICNLLLIPYLQAAGAVIATVISEITICVVYYYMSKDFVSLQMLLKYAIKPLLASIVMLGVVYLIGKGHEGSIVLTFLQILSGAAIYFVISFFLKNEIVRYAICFASDRYLKK